MEIRLIALNVNNHSQAREAAVGSPCENFFLTLMRTELGSKMPDANGKDHYPWKAYNPLGASK